MTQPVTPLRVGVVGTGAISQIVHVPVFVERDDVDVVAMADRDPHKAETLSRRFGVPLVMEADELLEHDELDAVVLCTPSGLHEAQAVKALELGKHVLVERPVAFTSAGAQRVLDAAERAGKVLFVGMPHRYRPEVSALRDFVVGGELGRIYAARANWMTRPGRAARSRWREDPELSGGGALMDLGVAALDMCLWLIGYPAVKRVSCVTDAEPGELEGAATVMVETESGVAMTLEVTNRLFAGNDRHRARVMGTEGSGSLPPLDVHKQLGGRPMDVTPRQPKPQGGENAYTNAYRRLLDDFVRGVLGQTDVELPTEQPTLMGVVEAAYRSAELGHEVAL